MFILNGTLNDCKGNTLLIPWASFDRYSAFSKYRMSLSNMQGAVHGRLVNQLNWAQSVFIGGGDTPRLVWMLNREEPEWREQIKTKTVVAQSAGISALMCYSFNYDHMCIIKGTGILPYNSIVHFTEAKLHGVKMLEHFAPEQHDIILLGDDECLILK